MMWNNTSVEVVIISISHIPAPQELIANSHYNSFSTQPYRTNYYFSLGHIVEKTCQIMVIPLHISKNQTKPTTKITVCIFPPVGHPVMRTCQIMVNSPHNFYTELYHFSPGHLVPSLHISQNPNPNTTFCHFCFSTGTHCKEDLPNHG